MRFSAPNVYEQSNTRHGYGTYVESKSTCECVLMNNHVTMWIVNLSFEFWTFSASERTSWMNNCMNKQQIKWQTNLFLVPIWFGLFFIIHMKRVCLANGRLSHDKRQWSYFGRFLVSELPLCIQLCTTYMCIILTSARKNRLDPTPWEKGFPKRDKTKELNPFRMKWGSISTNESTRLHTHIHCVSRIYYYSSSFYFE